MNIDLPRIIQGGMGAGVSNWRLAQAVSRLGQLGVVSGTALDEILARRLQDGDPGGHVRRALEHFPFQAMAARIVDRFFVNGGKGPDKPYQGIGKHIIEGRRLPHELSIAGNFVEVFLAREGHANPVGINYLEKIQLPHLPAIYGAMLAGVAVVIVGAGIPLAIPAILDAFVQHEEAAYPVHVWGARAGESYLTTFNPAAFHETDQPLPMLKRPDFLPIVASYTLAAMLCKRVPGAVAGFIVEGACAGGHNAPPRGQLELSEDGEPVYGPRDVVDPASIQKLGLPFWLAGSYGSPTRIREALAQGAAGVQVGTAFALCEESGLAPEIKRTLVSGALSGDASVRTDPLASPTGFPFKVAKVSGSLSDPDVYEQRDRLCDLGFLRELYTKEDGSIGYRCAAEPEVAFVAKGGDAADTVGRKCLCNALVANIGMPQLRPDGRTECALVTLGEDLECIHLFCNVDHPQYTAKHVIRVLLDETV